MLGFHLFPFRTEKLSLITPMVLQLCGRVGRRRFLQDPCKAICEGLLRLCLRLRSGTNETQNLPRLLPRRGDGYAQAVFVCVYVVSFALLSPLRGLGACLFIILNFCILCRRKYYQKDKLFLIIKLVKVNFSLICAPFYWVMYLFWKTNYITTFFNE